MTTSLSPSGKASAVVYTTYDFANSAMVMKAVDVALSHYFGAEDWLTVRNRLFPGLRRPLGPSG